MNEALLGALWGSAVGDALGLPYEGLTPKRAERLLGAPDRHRFLLGRGMISDDTEHLTMTAQALCASPASPEEFAWHLAWKLRWWLACVPAGIGLATLRAILKLWIGWPLQSSGVQSAGNGPAMRSTLLGAGTEDLPSLRNWVLASTRLTHTDPKAFYGALAVAVAAWCARRQRNDYESFHRAFQEGLGESVPADFAQLLHKLKTSLETGEDTKAFARALGLQEGVTGYMYHTVPVVLHAWLSQGRDYAQAISSIIACGKDTDSTAAILGAILGSGLGSEGIPARWLAPLWEWPRSLDWMKRLGRSTAQALEMKTAQPYPRVNALLVLPRNAIFLGAVFLHALRRLRPW